MSHASRLAAFALGAAALVAGLGPASLHAADPPVAIAEKLLLSKEPDERLRGLTMLAEMEKSTRSEKAAIGALRDQDWAVQIAACGVLGKIGADPAAKALADHVVEGEIQWVRDAAADALAALDPEGAAARLVDIARGSRDDDVKVRALIGAGRAGGKDAIAKIDDFANSRDLHVAAAALRAIARLARHAAVRNEVMAVIEPILKSRGDKKQFFAYGAALAALSEMDSPEARGLLMAELLQQPDDDGYVQERVARAFTGRPAEEVVGGVRNGLSQAKKPEEIRRVARLAGRVGSPELRTDLEPLLAHKEERVRSDVALAIGLCGDPAAAPALTNLLADKSPYVRLEAVTALARVLPHDQFRGLGERIRKDGTDVVRLQYVVEIADHAEPAAIPHLVPFLEDASWRVASAAAATVGTLGIADDLKVLTPFATHKNWRVRAAALEGMGRLRAANAIPYLIEGLLDKDPVVRGVCHANLQILTSLKHGPEPGPWRAFWEKNGSTLALVKRSRLPDAVKRAEEERNKRYAPTREQAIEVLQKARMLVVTGAWDHVEKVLGHLEIPHTVLRAQQLKDAGINPNQIILVNCEGNMDEDSRSRVQWFVNVGGYLMTTDWALTKTIEPAFPGYLRQFSGSSTGNDVVAVEEARPGHPLTAGIFENVPGLEWWLEVQAFPMVNTWPERCDVLVDSAEMRQRYGSSPMAAVFRWGLGKVQHSMSHFYLQEEGMQQAQKPRDRMIFAADSLGVSLDQIRRLAKEGRFDGRLNEETMKQIAPDYSMFRLIVNMVREKSDWVENL